MKLEKILIDDLLLYNALQIQDAESRYIKSVHHENMSFKKYFEDIYIIEHAENYRKNYEEKQKHDCKPERY